MNGRAATRAPAEEAGHGLEVVLSDRLLQQVTVVSGANNLFDALTDMKRYNTQLLNVSGNPITNGLEVRDFIQLQLGREGYAVTPMDNIFHADAGYLDNIIAAPKREDGSQDLSHAVVFTISEGVASRLSEFQAEQVLEHYQDLTVSRSLPGGVTNERGENFSVTFYAKPGEYVSPINLVMNMDEYDVNFSRSPGMPIQRDVTVTLLAISLLEQSGYAVQRFDTIFDVEARFAGYILVAPKNEDGTMNLFSAELLASDSNGRLGKVADTAFRDEAIGYYSRLQRQE